VLSIGSGNAQQMLKPVVGLALVWRNVIMPKSGLSLVSKGVEIFHVTVGPQIEEACPNAASSILTQIVDYLSARKIMSLFFRRVDFGSGSGL
jgi:multisubunit Na+/H+ antiporter MnhC subunit